LTHVNAATGQIAYDFAGFKTEGHMSALEFTRELAKRAAALMVSRGRPEFACGDCERWERCGLTPSENCIFKAEQLARRERRPRHILMPRGMRRAFY
jgi:hypothetical protein